MPSGRKRVLALSVACSMLAAPLWSAAPKPLGMVLHAERAKLRSDGVQAGTNVYAGDSVSTEPQGTLRMKLGAAQIHLGSASEAAFQESEGRITAELTRGSIGFAVQGEEALLIYAGGAWIRAQSTGATRGEIRLINSHEIMVSSFNGPLEVIVDEEVSVVPQNQTARVQMAPEYQQIEGVGKEKARRRMVAFWIVAGATAAIVVPIVLYNTHPNRSPYVP